MTVVDKILYQSGFAGGLSLLSGYVARCPLPMFCREWVLRRFAGTFGVNLAEVEYPLQSYGSVDQFFTRGLRPGCRLISREAQVVSPVDGCVLAQGPVSAGQVFQAKGLSYSLEALVGREVGGAFDAGAFVTFYLSPKDCHRIFSPASGYIENVRWIPGRLFPVREPYISGFSGLYTVNERVVVEVRTPKGLVMVVMVGAFNVGRISLPFDSDFISHRFETALQSRTYSPTIPIEKGEWLGTFHLGSTVVMVGEPGCFEPDSRWTWGTSVQYGEPLGCSA